MVSSKRIISLRIPPGVDKEKFINTIMDSVQSQFADYTVKGDKVLIKLVGDPVSVERSIGLIKDSYRELLLESKMKVEGITILPKDRVARFLGVPVPFEALKILMNLTGTEFREYQDYIVIQEDLEVVSEYARRIYNVIEELKHEARGKAREVIAVVSAYTGRDPDDIIRVGVEKGLFKKIQGRVVICKEKINVIRDLITTLESTG